MAGMSCTWRSRTLHRSKCNAFVQTTAWPKLGSIDVVIVRKVEVQERLRDWFATLPRSVTIASDSQHDRGLLADALDGKWPNNLSGWFDLRLLIDTGGFNRAVEQYHTPVTEFAFSFRQQPIVINQTKKVSDWQMQKAGSLHP